MRATMRRVRVRAGVELSSSRRPATTCRIACSTARAACSRTSRRCSPTSRKADVVFVGEQHDEPNTHRLELASCKASRRAGRTRSSRSRCSSATCRSRSTTFRWATRAKRSSSRPPGPGRATRPTTSRSWTSRSRRTGRSIAANVPRAIASEVAKGGLDVLQIASPTDQQACSRTICKCPTDDEYFKRFAEAMGGHPGRAGQPARPPIAAARQTLERYLLRAVPEGRDDGRVDRARRTRSARPAASRRSSCTSTARFTATSAWAPPSAPSAGCPASASSS